MDINESKRIMETKNACTKHQMKMINKLGFDTYRDKRTGYVVSKEGDFYLTMNIDQCIDWIRTQFNVVIYHKEMIKDGDFIYCVGSSADINGINFKESQTKIGFLHTEQYIIYVEVEKFQYRQTNHGEDICDINAIIYCIRESHKGIIIGKDGSKLKKIGTYARQDLEKILDVKINLKLWVKVNKEWQEKDNIIKDNSSNLEDNKDVLFLIGKNIEDSHQLFLRYYPKNSDKKQK